MSATTVRPHPRTRARVDRPETGPLALVSIVAVTATGPPRAGTCSTTGPSRSPARCCASTATRPGRTSGGGSWPRPRRAGGWSLSTSWAWAGRTGCPSPGGWPSGSTTSADLTAALGIDGPVVTVAHDWGGPISLGWALAHRDQLAGLVLTNTAVAAARRTAAPALIRLARTPALRATGLRPHADLRPRRRRAVPPAAAAARSAGRCSAAPYALPPAGAAIGDFVADIPLEAGPPEPGRADAVAERARAAADVPALVLWGPRDPVFTRGTWPTWRPTAAGRRAPLPAASHLVTEDAPEAAEHAWRWVARPSPTAAPVRAAVRRRRPHRRSSSRLPWAALAARERGRPRGAGGGRAARRPRSADLLRRAGARGSRTSPPACTRPASAPATGSPCWSRRDRPHRRRLRLLAGRRGDRGRRRRAGPARPGPRAAQRRARPRDRHPPGPGSRRAALRRARAVGSPVGRLRARLRRAARLAGRAWPSSAAAVAARRACRRPPGRRRGGGAVHLRRDRPGQGRGLPPRPAAAPSSSSSGSCAA